MTKRTHKAFTLVELLVVISIIALLVGLLLPAIGRARKNAQQVKDGTQVRAIHQGLVAWANLNDERYPLPHVLDDRDQTEKDYGGGNKVGIKDRTGNVWSILIFNKIVPAPEVFVSPSEANPNIRPIRMDFGPTGAIEFQTVRPGEGDGVMNVETPANALWDPSFKGAPVPAKTGQGVESDVPDNVGNNSYAHSPLRGVHYLERWGSLYAQATIPVVGNRGPVFKFQATPPTNAEDWELDTTIAKYPAYSLLIHGGKSTWEGNIGYNDGHVKFETSFCPESQVIIDGPNKYPDNLFFSELLKNDNSEERQDNCLFIWKKGLDLRSTSQTEKFAFLPQGKPDRYWADELEEPN